MTQDLLASAAVKDIISGMKVGLGTGRAATRAIRALAAQYVGRGFTAKETRHA